jgi:hypothetical protein
MFQYHYHCSPGLTHLIHSLQILHRAKPGVTLDPVRLVHKLLRLVQKSSNVILCALRAIIVVHAGPFGDPDGTLEGGVEVFHVLDEVVGIDIVVICAIK